MKKIVLLFLCVFLLGVMGTGGLISAQTEVPGGIIEELKLFSKTINAIMEGYVEDRQPRQIFYEAVRGIAKSLDRFSSFIDPEQFELLMISMKGEYAGIGTWIKESEGFIIIDKIKPETPADRADIEVGDRILKVDGILTEGKNAAQVGAMLRGEADTAVLLTLFRVALERTLEVEIMRERIEIEAVKDVRIVGRAVGYMRIAEWNDHTIEQIDTALERLEKDGMEALIMDVRFNAGGIMGSAVELSERFLPKDAKILSVKSKVQVQAKEHFSTGEHQIKDYPMVILVNQTTASASEIFSAAMQDHQRATIVGDKTFGKASVQSVIPLDEVSALRLTTARYRSPQGREIDGIGITPDVEVADTSPSDPDGQLQIKKALEILKDYYY